MANDPFQPKLGRASSKRTPRNERVFKLVAKEAGKSLRKGRRRADPLTSRPVAELARGKGSFHALLPPRPGTRMSS
jgi:hypothetical protein